MIYVIGTGPGEIDQITQKALDALKKCEIIMGYSRYIDLLRDYMPDKDFRVYSMREEIKRCNDALNLSLEGKVIGLISSGDPGVYGMAGLMLETAKGKNQHIEIISGITAACSCASIIGAPLMNDYICVSLSDILTSWEIIEKRLIAACYGDLVICLYNPASNHRPENFRNACKILIDNGKNIDTVCAYVRNSGRENEESKIMKLGEIMNCDDIDMLCTVFIGNSQSFVIDGKFVTLRGYTTNK